MYEVTVGSSAYQILCLGSRKVDGCHFLNASLARGLE